MSLFPDLTEKEKPEQFKEKPNGRENGKKRRVCGGIYYKVFDGMNQLSRISYRVMSLSLF